MIQAKSILLFLVYPNLSSTIISTFPCTNFDDGSSWLTIDVTINCNAPDRLIWLVIAGLGVIVYVVGVPAFYIYSLYRVRNEINPPNDKTPDKRKFAHVLFLTEVYKREYWSHK